MKPYILAILVMLCAACAQSDRRDLGSIEQMQLLEIPRKKKILSDSDIVYVLKHDYPGAYQDIVADSRGYYTGKVDYIIDVDQIGLVFFRGSSIDAILSEQIIVYRESLYIARAKPVRIADGRIIYQLFDKAEGRTVAIGDICQAH
jgi:hypothetical protein